ncbi:MAG: HNH endonuclease [Hyphomonadaceae bacterium]
MAIKSKKPWMKFYPDAWLSDDGLAMCSMSAHGLWINLMAYMHKADPYGHLVIKGRAPTVEVIAKLTRCSLQELTSLLSELESAGVLSRTDDGIIYSRRMVRDEEMAEVGATNVRIKWGESASTDPSIQDGVSNATKRSRRLRLARQKGTHNATEWQALLDIFQDTCVSCGASNGVQICKDHIVPLYQDGDDSISNIQPMCRKCNAAKGSCTKDFRADVVPNWREQFSNIMARHYTPTKAPTKRLEVRGKNKNPPTPPDRTVLLETCWSRWPKRGKERTTRAKVLSALSRINEPAERVSAAVSAYLNSPDAKKNDHAYVPGLHTWLRDRLDVWLELIDVTPTTGASDSPKPEWFLDLASRFRAAGMDATWRDHWAMCKPVSDGRTVTLRTPSEKGRENRIALRKVDEFEEITGRRLNLLGPEPTPSR